MQQPSAREQTYSDNGHTSKQPEDKSFWQQTIHEPINAFTAVLAVLTVALVVAGLWQGRLTQQSIQLARDEFISTHRPRLMLREAFLGNAFKDADRLHIYFVIANVGSSDATIVESEKVCSFSDDPLAAMIPRRGNINELGDVTIKPGTTSSFDLLHPVLTNEYVLGSSIRCLLMARVAYSDRGGRQYEMAFVRQLDRRLLRFVPPLPSEVSSELNYE